MSSNHICPQGQNREMVYSPVFWISLGTEGGRHRVGDYGGQREGSLQNLPSESSFSLLFGSVSVTRFLSIGHPLHRAEQAFWVTNGISVLLFTLTKKFHGVCFSEASRTGGVEKNLICPALSINCPCSPKYWKVYMLRLDCRLESHC